MVPADPDRRWHHQVVPEDGRTLRIDADDAAGASLRVRLDWRTFAWLVIAIVTALAVVAVLRNTTSMLTRIGIGFVVALALDPVVVGIKRRWHVRRGVAVVVVAMATFALAGLLGVVLGPRAVAEARKFSDQLPETLDELETLPIVGRYLRDNRFADRAQEWLRDLPQEFTDDRVAEYADALVNGIASVLIITVIVIAVLIDGENLLHRFRLLLPPSRRAQADQVGGVLYRTLGRYFGGSITLAILMGLWVLALGLILGVPLAPLAAIWAMLTNLIPQVGGFLGGSFFVLLATTAGVTTALLAALGFIVYMSCDNHLLQPLIIGRSVDLTPPTTMVAAFAGAAIAGVPGALVATPFVGAVKALYLEARGRAKPEAGDRGGFVGRLKGLLHRRR